MDSLTHAMLGAALGHVVAGRSDRADGPAPGRTQGAWRALLIGAGIAWIPDIDVALGYWLSDAAALTFHRGPTHSISFAVGISLLLGFLLHRVWSDVSRGRWTALAALVLASHLLLDSLTSYGIQLLQPFSDHSFAIASVSVIDPLYTAPLLAVLVVPWLNRRHGMALVGGALVLSSMYLLSTLFYQHHATAQIRAGLNQAGIPVERLFVKPTLFNSFLWRGIAVSGDRYVVTFYSRRDALPPADFIHFERNGALLEPYQDEPVVQDLLKVSDGFYQAVREDSELLFRDLRYGQAFEWLRDDRPHVFTYRLVSADDGSLDLETLTLQREPKRDRATFTALIARAKGLSDADGQTRPQPPNGRSSVERGNTTPSG